MALTIRGSDKVCNAKCVELGIIYSLCLLENREVFLFPFFSSFEQLNQFIWFTYFSLLQMGCTFSLVTLGTDEHSEKTVSSILRNGEELHLSSSIYEIKSEFPLIHFTSFFNYFTLSLLLSFILFQILRYWIFHVLSFSETINSHTMPIFPFIDAADPISILCIRL